MLADVRIACQDISFAGFTRGPCRARRPVQVRIMLAAACVCEEGGVVQITKHRPIVAPFAWSGADLQKTSNWIRRFSRPELDELDAALSRVKERGLEWLDV